MIRNAKLDDIESITAIYNEAITEGSFTGDLLPLSVENRRAWFQDHENSYAVFVAELDGAVIGYVALSPYRKGRQAFSGTCEISYYLASRQRGRGIGKQLIKHATRHAIKAGFDVMVAIILGCNQRSIKMLGQFGFTECGRLPMAAKINGIHIDHVYLSRTLASHAQPIDSLTSPPGP